MTQRLGRAIVRSEPSVIYVAEAEECELHLFVPSKRLDDNGTIDSPEVVVQLNAAPAIPCGDENSPSLPFDRDFVVYMNEGDVLWAVSPGESLVSFSALPMWRRG
jgi:hypothetical protein